MDPGALQLKSVKVLVETAYGERITVEYPLETYTQGVFTLDIPVTDVCDATDLGNFPLHLLYYYITYNAVASGEQYSLKIPGMELVYANMPQSTTITGDVNGDGEVGIADINAIIDLILSGGFLPVADVNSDDEVNIADINAVIDIILGKE